jgi:hypothetical protein
MGSLQEKVAHGRHVSGGGSEETQSGYEIDLRAVCTVRRRLRSGPRRKWPLPADFWLFTCLYGKTVCDDGKRTHHVSKLWGSSGRPVTGHVLDFCVVASDSDKQKQRSAEAILRGRR